MSIEQALIARAGPYVMERRIQNVLSLEVNKGCQADLSEVPLQLEPRFVPVDRWSEEEFSGENHFIPAEETAGEYIRLQAWVSPKHELQWDRAESFIKLLSGLKHRMGFEISGNEQEIIICFFTHEDDLELLKIAVAGEYPQCEIAPFGKKPGETEPLYEHIQFLDFFPSPPYTNRLTQPRELHFSPLEPFIHALVSLPREDKGFVQVLFEPVRHDWHHNVKALLDFEFTSKLIRNPGMSYWSVQQTPSGDLSNMAQELETKAHNDKPFYFAALKTGVISSRISSSRFQAVTSFARLFQHGGLPLRFITGEDYQRLFSDERIREMFQHGLAYRPGFLVNSSELSGLVHLPYTTDFKEKEVPLDLLEPLRVHGGNLDTGILIGYSHDTGQEKEIRIPESIQPMSGHLIGKWGSGKSCLLEHMSLQDIKDGKGVAVIDPHGDTVEHLLACIPEDMANKVIYIDFGDPAWVPIWNPLKRTYGQDMGRTADELVNAIKSTIHERNWGDRLEHLLRHGMLGLLHLPNTTLLDLSNLLQPAKTADEERKKLHEMILAAVENEAARKFWKAEFNNYRQEDMAPPKHKLSKLLVGDTTVSLMLSQPDSFLDFQEIMESQRILLVNLSKLGPDVQGILGCFMLSLLHLAALSRSRLDPDERKKFHIYCDEAHKLATGSLEDTLAETRKFGVSLFLSHQFMRQFQEAQRDALSSVGSTIIFNVDIADAQYLMKALRGKVEPQDLFELEQGQAIARIGTKIVKISTPKPLETPKINFKEQIIQQSRERYYRPAALVKHAVRQRANRWQPEFGGIRLAEAYRSSELPAEKCYDEWE